MSFLQGVFSSLIRHFRVNNTRAYEQVLQYVASLDDVWMASQGEYMAWWRRRDNADLKIMVSDGECRVCTSLELAVIEQFPGKFLDAPVVPCPNSTFSGEVWITIDEAIKQKDWLIEFLKREGILNFRIATDGEFFLSQQEMRPLLTQIEEKQCQRRYPRPFEEDIQALRQIVIDKLSTHNLPLLRIWYHPRINGIIPKAVFSPRYDVDRGITNLAAIRALEKKYKTPSTLYIRVFCPFYSQQMVKELAAAEWCSEIALHGEFVTNARRYGNELAAAQAEKAHLEALCGRTITGVCMHGGELTDNKSPHTTEVVQEAGFLYDTTMTFGYYFPFRPFYNGQPSESYMLCHAVSDIAIPANKNYGQLLRDQAVEKMNEIYNQNGVFVMMQHPIYFSFFNYLRQPKNWVTLAKFLLRHLTRSHLATQHR